MAIPLSFGLILAMGLGPFTPYRLAKPAVVWRRIRNPLRTALAVTAAFVLFGTRNGWILFAVLTGSFVITLAIRQLWTTARTAAAKRGGSVAGQALRSMRRDRPYWGGQIAHIGVVLLAIGIAVSSNSSVEGSFRLAPGDTAEFAGFEITYLDAFTRDEPNRSVIGAEVELRRGGDLISTLEPRLNRYPTSAQAVSSPSVDTGLRGDFYSSLAAIDADGVTVDVFWFPFIWLVWAGGFLAAAGGLWAWLVPPLRRSERSPEREADRV
jgi:cytochrome c-type biogenesis protein CcmF